MNVSEFLTEVRGILDDPNDLVSNPSMKFQDATLLTYLTRHVRALCRIQAQKDEGFHNFPIVLKTANARQVVTNVQEWPLPTWIVSISRVRVKVGADDPVAQPTFSPFMWNAGGVPVTEFLQKRAKWVDYGWELSANHTFRVWGYDMPPSVYLEVCKLPSRLFKATIDQNGTSASQFYLPTTLTLGSEDTEEGAYCNAEIQVTGSTTISQIGQVRRGVYSNANVNSGGGVRKTQITLEAPLPATLAVGDAIETLIPYGEEHARLLLLKVAWSCFEQLANKPAQAALQASLSEEMLKFIDYVTPRTQAEVESWHRPWMRRRRTSDDQATAMNYYW